MFQKLVLMLWQGMDLWLRIDFRLFLPDSMISSSEQGIGSMDGWCACREGGQHLRPSMNYEL